MQSLPKRASITEVGTRDGLQSESGFYTTEQKVAMIHALTEAGISEFEVTSFVHPKLVPQMSDAEAVLAGIERRPGVRYSVLVPNVKGAQRALACDVDEIRINIIPSETFNKRNWNMTIAESQQQLTEVVELVRGSGKPIRLLGFISVAFGCPYEGDVPEDRVFGLIDWFQELGVDGISLADSTGMGNPAQVRRIMTKVLDRWPHVEFTVHLHNTRGMGLANVYAALQAGVSRFDAAIGGLGGCPFAPKASGNICTVDTVHMLEEMGITTGVTVDKLIAAAHMAEELVGRQLPGMVYRAGKRSDISKRT